MKNILILLTGYKTPISRTPNSFAPAYRTGRPLHLCALIFLCAFAPLRDLSAQKAIHELPTKTTIDTNYLFIQGNPTTGKLYKTRGAALNAFISGGGGTATDTTSLSNRIDLKLNISDTAGLSNRIDAIGPHIDTTSIDLRINLKQDILTTGSIDYTGSIIYNKPTIPAQFNPIAGTNMSLSGSYPDITFNASGGGGGSQTLDQTLALGNVSDTNLIIDRTATIETAGIFPGMRIDLTAGSGSSFDRMYSYFTNLNITGGEVAYEVAGYSSLVQQDSGITNTLEGFGAVMEFYGGTTEEIRSFASTLVIANDVGSRVTSLRSQITHSAGDVANLVGVGSSITQSGGTSDAFIGINSQNSIGGSNTSVKGYNNNLAVTGGTNPVTHGISSVIDLQGGTNGSVIGELVQLNLTGGTNTVATALDVYGPNGISADPTVAYFRSRMASSFGVVITAHASQSQSLFSIFNSSWGYLFNVGATGQTGIGSIADASAQLTVTSTTKGFLPPRMTKTQRDAISSPATGLVVYQTDNTPGLRCYNGTNWMRYTETAD